MAARSLLLLCIFLALFVPGQGITQTKAPTKATTKAPTKATTKAPTKATTKAPTKATTNTKAPTKATTNTKAPTKATTYTTKKAPTKATTYTTKKPYATTTACPYGSVHQHLFKGCKGSCYAAWVGKNNCLQCFCTTTTAPDTTTPPTKATTYTTKKPYATTTACPYGSVHRLDFKGCKGSCFAAWADKGYNCLQCICTTTAAPKKCPYGSVNKYQFKGCNYGCSSRWAESTYNCLKCVCMTTTPACPSGHKLNLQCPYGCIKRWANPVCARCDCPSTIAPKEGECPLGFDKHYKLDCSKLGSKLACPAVRAKGNSKCFRCSCAKMLTTTAAPCPIGSVPYSRFDFKGCGKNCAEYADKNYRCVKCACKTTKNPHSPDGGLRIASQNAGIELGDVKLVRSGYGKLKVEGDVEVKGAVHVKDLQVGYTDFGKYVEQVVERVLSRKSSD